jgi:amino acid adenylation domain-containing protein
MTSTIQQLPTAFDLAGTAPVPQMVNAQADRVPEALAVRDGCNALTYRELNDWATCIANHLRLLGVGPEVLVGIYLERSAEMVAAALGVLKAGGVYVPLDTTHPRERLHCILQDSDPMVVLTNTCVAKSLPPGKWKTLIVGDFPTNGGSSSEDVFDCPAKPDNLAYVIYTSGSTGAPKGVELLHRGLSNLVIWHQLAFQVSLSDRASHLASLIFDASVWEIWPYLCAGASIHVTDDRVRNDPVRLRDWLIEQQITIAFVPTPLAERIISLEWPPTVPLRYLLTGGDRLQNYPGQNLPFALVNNYGPTECTVVATSGLVSASRTAEILPPIGRPIANTEVYILNDSRERQVGPGESGEICIAGLGVARGYRNRPDLTAQNFISHPFAPNAADRLYCTGDRGRYLPDGQIEFLGRTDDQIKIRGCRIETAEITASLNAHPSIRESTVIARENGSGERELVAYLVLDAGMQLSSNALRTFLESRVPHYAIPDIFIRLDALPTNANGKIDRMALPDPSVSNMLHDESRPASPAIERAVSSIVTKLLSGKQVGRDDNFFLLGGHSLLAAQLVTAVNNAFSIELPLLSIFRCPTVAELSAEVQRLKATTECL